MDIVISLPPETSSLQAGANREKAPRPRHKDERLKSPVVPPCFAGASQRSALAGASDVSLAAQRSFYPGPITGAPRAELLIELYAWIQPMFTPPARKSFLSQPAHRFSAIPVLCSAAYTAYSSSSSPLQHIQFITEHYTCELFSLSMLDGPCWYNLPGGGVNAHAFS